MKKKQNIFRVTYRIENDYAKEPFISEIIIKSSKQQADINFEEIIKKYLDKVSQKKFKFRSIAIIEPIN